TIAHLVHAPQLYPCAIFDLSQDFQTPSGLRSELEQKSVAGPRTPAGQEVLVFVVCRADRARTPVSRKRRGSARTARRIAERIDCLADGGRCPGRSFSLGRNRFIGSCG